MSSPITSIYVLALAGGNKYVGISDDPAKALIAHKEGGVNGWTDMYPPIGIERVHTFVPANELDTYVVKYMTRYGMGRVRGGSWDEVNLPVEKRRTLYTRTNSMRKTCCIQ